MSDGIAEWNSVRCAAVGARLALLVAPLGTKNQLSRIQSGVEELSVKPAICTARLAKTAMNHPPVVIHFVSR